MKIKYLAEVETDSEEAKEVIVEALIAQSLHIQELVSNKSKVRIFSEDE